MLGLNNRLKLASPIVGGFVGALDAFTADLAVVWSVRRLLASYTGPVFKIRVDTTGQPEYDCYSLAEADAYSGSSSSYIRWFYDQKTGTAINIGQSTAATQPRIVNAGTLETGGARFLGSQCLDTASLAFSNFAGAQDVQVVAIAQLDGAANYRFFDFGPDQLSTWLMFGSQIYWDAPNPTARINYAPGGGFSGVQRSLSFERAASTSCIRVDGATTHMGSVSGNMSGTSIFRLGATTSGSGVWIGRVRDFVIWKNNTNAADRIAALAA